MKTLRSFSHRILAMILAVILFFGVMDFAVPTEAEAASKTLVTNAVISARIKDLSSKLNKTYWNTTHNRNACGTKCSGHGCSKCSNVNIIKQTWFKNLFGLNKLSTDKFPRTYTTSSYLHPRAQSCAGFASFAEWYIFRTSDSATVSTKKIGNYKSTKSNWTKYAQPGDLIRWNGHSFIYISNNDKGVKVLDCNWSGTDATGKKANNCMVQTHTIKYGWSSAKFTISRESTRATCKHTAGYQTEWNGKTYVATVCKNCGATYKFKVDTSYAGKAKTSSNATMYTSPYGDSPSITSIKANTTVKILGKVSNAYGNTWYQVSYTVSGTVKKGYIFSSYLKNFVC